MIAAIYLHWRSVLLARARFYVGPDDAEDVVQEAFTRLVAASASASVAASASASASSSASASASASGAIPDDAIPSWLYTTTRRLCLDHLRARRYRQHDLFVDEDAPSKGPDPEVMASTGEHRAQIALLIDALPEIQRVVLEARLVGTPFEVIASSCGIPTNTAKTRLHRAIQALAAGASVARHSANKCKRDVSPGRLRAPQTIKLPDKPALFTSARIRMAAFRFHRREA